MIDKYLQIETRGLVFLGDFNPAIFQPFWFASKGLLGEDEAENAQVEVVFNELSRFQVGGWLMVEVTRSRCEFKTMKRPYFLPMKDLVVNVFQILSETPIKAVGINNVYDLSLKNEDDYFHFGDALAPLSNWSGILHSPRLFHLEIIENQENDLLRRVNIMPTDPNLKVNFGVNISINHHFTLPDKSTGSMIADLVEDKSECCATNSKKLVSDILAKIFS